jgi:dTDP-4-dehydrorhamnose reductase
MEILITGANGRLGQELIPQGQALDFRIQSFNNKRLDITKEDQLKKVLTHVAPSIIIDAAAHTNVDNAENESRIASAVNENGPAYLSRYCVDHGLVLLHISTDYVFDGIKGQPYRKNNAIARLGLYGQSTAQGEAVIRSALKNHIIVRTSWLYGVYGDNFVKTILKLSHESAILRMVADQFGSPTSAADLAETLLIITKKIAAGGKFDWGTYHYCGKGITTWHGPAEKII